MSKRQADDIEEETANQAGSPASKKPRIDSGAAPPEAPEVNGSVRTAPPQAPSPPCAESANDAGQANGEANAAGSAALADADKPNGGGSGPGANAGADADPDADNARAADINEDESAVTSHRRQEAPVAGYTDLYLDTINRAVLDFDFEKLCSVTLSNINVYACLVCGRYYQGKGPRSHAYFHALELAHHVFVNMETKRVYVLPEGYEVKSKSLDDIKFVVDPRYTKDEVARLDAEPRASWDLAGKRYIPGSTPFGPRPPPPPRPPGGGGG